MIGAAEGQPDYGMRNAAGNTPPGAAYPFGMVLWSPDTTNEAGGYRYSQDRITGFSLTHFSGRGASCYQDVPIQPVTALAASPGAAWQEYGARFSHQNETATPGLYSVAFDSGIRTELTVTARTGFARFQFPGNTGTLLINASGSANGNRDSGTGIHVWNSSLVTGSAASGDCGGYFTYRVYFAIQFDRPAKEYGVWKGESLFPRLSSASGVGSGAYVTFKTEEGTPVMVKVGLSFVSEDNALRNIVRENPEWQFEDTAGRARSAWNERLSRVAVQGGSDDQRVIFYTALYHSLLHPSIFSDANGDYLGFDNAIHNSGSRIQYHNFASWDNYRSQMPLLAMIAPEAGDMMQSLVNDAVQDPGGGLPRWQHANTNSGGMIGDSQTAVIASAYALGVRDFDAPAALAAMDRGASIPGTTSGGQLVREGLEDYMRLGYVSTRTWGSAARTLEYATADFSIARLARALGDQTRYTYYQKRAQNWRNLFRNGYFVPRNPNGSYLPNFEPSGLTEFVEGSAAQYRWMVPFNLGGLFRLMGGNKVAIQELDRYFTELNAGPGSEFSFIGNEPGLKTPWAYAFAGAPYRTQQVVRNALLSYFRRSPDGMPGNDDGGTLSAWAVFASIGLYPNIPGVGGMVVGSPIFTNVEMRLAYGAVIRIDAPAAAADRPYVRQLKVNGTPSSRAWIPWSALSEGGSVEFDLSASAEPAWGAVDLPPSYDEPQP
jgi:predicted alpha-1,2-mannosidase